MKVLDLGAIQPEKLHFKYLTEENGLTNSYIYCIEQDQKGFIWIGTDNGLYRYDGFRMKHYLNLPGDTTSINSNVIYKLYTDTHDNLWIGTFIGLMRYEEEFDHFFDFNFQNLYRNGLPLPINGITENNDSLVIVSTDVGIILINPVEFRVEFIRSGSPQSNFKGNNVTTCYTDRSGNLWVGTEQGITKINPESSYSTFYRLGNYASRDFITTFIHRIYEDNQNNIWVTTREEGVFMKPRSSERFKQFYYTEENKNSLGSNETFDIYEDTDGQIWISTNGGGLNLYNRKTQTFRRIKHASQEKGSLLNNNVRTIFKDRQGNIWIASFQAGVNILINHPQLFRYYDISSNQPVDYQSSTVCSILQYEDNKLWIGTDGGGLKLLDRNKGLLRTYLPENNDPGSFPDKVVMTIYKDRYGNYWFGTYQGGLVTYNIHHGNFISYKNNPANPLSIQSNFVTSITEDRKGNLWIGTNGGGLNLFDRNSKEFRAFVNNPDDTNTLISNFINDVIEDHNDHLWIGTFWGLSRFNVQEMQFINYSTDKSDIHSLSDNTVFSLFEDQKKRIWIGTRNGLNLYNSSEDRFQYINMEGLSGCSIYGILEDNLGNLWISSNKGLTKFNPEKMGVINFSESDGLQGNEFFRNSCYKSTKGELFFGGINGFNAFFPDEVKPREYIPNVVITGFKIFDEDIPIGKLSDGRTILDKTISETSQIKLRYSDKVFSFELAALDFITPENIVYAYKMNGFDESWNYTDAQYPVITYTNLGAGDYTLLIKAANSNIINQIDRYTQLHIKIIPPAWKSWWAYLVYVLLLLALSYYIWKLTLQRIKEREQVRLEIIRREKAEELNQAKLSFFTNISHEFRTPLTLIIGPLEQLIKKGKEVQPFQRQFDIMLKNARRMLRLINQLLDFRKIEGAKMTLKAEHSDIVKFLHDIIHSFEEYASAKQINLKYISPENPVMCWFDPDKMDKILFNLISNAFKFTSPGGSVIIELKPGIKAEDTPKKIREYIQILVSDTGGGIPEKDLPYLFERFYQAENSFYQGSGLGLSLSKNFIELHNGKISVYTSSNGTTFTVLLPADDSHLNELQKVMPESPGINKYIHIGPEPIAIQSEPKTNDIIVHLHSKPTVLLVEDNLELRQYIRDEAHEYYNFYEAQDGAEGFEMAVEIMPDLIISDIMMPEMNGYEFCRKIKHELVTSHIPVILLTAKSSVESQIKGYESGADAYIPKPFQIDHLVANANSIIENRIRLREKFDAHKILSDLPIKNTADNKFIQKVNDLVNVNISEVGFGVLELSKELGISRVHLHRKLKSITNISPNEFIKNIRLQQARDLLLQREFTISEVCYKVGFNSPAYFSSCFKTFYKMSPSEFVDRNSQE